MTRYGDVLEVSNSELQAFGDCRRRWWLIYFRSLRARRTAPVGPLSIGSRAHTALEQGYSSPGREAAMFKVLAETIEADYPKAVETGRVEQFEKECELVLIMLQGFVDWAAEEGLDAGWEVVSEERIVRGPPMDFNGQLVVLKGKLDQIIRRLHDDSLWMRDWKTTQEKDPSMLQFGPQLKMYRLLLALTEPEAAVSGGQFVFLRKVKRTAKAEPPFYYTREETLSSTQMANFWRQTIASTRRLAEAVAELDSGADHHEVCPPRPTRDCSWRCPFYAICDMFDDGSDVERLLADLYEVVDPYDYYSEDPDEDDAESQHQ